MLSNLSPQTALEYLDFAHELADAARLITTRYFRQPLAVLAKADASPVTIADRETEEKLRTMITVRYPSHAIIGEELGSSGDSPWHWILDPIDGTKSFVSGFPVYCTLIALMYEDTVIASVIDMPKLNERFSAHLFAKTTLNGAAISCSQKSDMADVLCYSTTPSMFTARQTQQVAQLRHKIRQHGYMGDGYLYGMLAAGWIDMVIEADMKPHDYLPLVRIVEQAGGIITDWHGAPLTQHSNGEILASANEVLHQQALLILANS